MAHPKGLLIERLEKLGLGKPEFRTANTGPDHQPTFLSDVVVAGDVYGTGQGATKREAERLAAEEALAYLDREQEPAGASEADEEQDGPSALQASSAGEGAEEEFQGPWPVFERLLATALEVANARTSVKLDGAEAREEIRDFTLELYKELLGNLGEVVDVEDDDERQS